MNKSLPKILKIKLKLFQCLISGNISCSSSALVLKENFILLAKFVHKSLVYTQQSKTTIITYLEFSFHHCLSLHGKFSNTNKNKPQITTILLACRYIIAHNHRNLKKNIWSKPKSHTPQGLCIPPRYICQESVHFHI
jgi:hypothetical protein